jgi:ABC-type uncharacterized transport system ATPase subunit
MPTVLELRGITKTFPGVLANDHIDLTLEKGEIHALLGENGAGKTTLMNILYGLYKPDEGDILVSGEKVDIHSPNDAIAYGIGMVHQHFMLVPVMTVTENVMLGIEPTRNGIFLDQAKVAKHIREISAQYGLEVDPNSYIKDLPVGIQQRVEIIKVLYREADILILDEPTAVLTPQEVGGLFKILNTLIEKGKSIIFITHKLKEVMSVADRITHRTNSRHRFPERSQPAKTGIHDGWTRCQPGCPKKARQAGRERTRCQGSICPRRTQEHGGQWRFL